MFVKTVSFCALMMVATFANAYDARTAPANYIAFGTGWSYPQGACTYFAAMEFGANTPAGMVNWGGHAAQWMEGAKQQGWQTTTNPWRAEVGAIIVWTGGSYGHVAIVRQVIGERIVIEEMNGGSNLLDPRMGKTEEFNVVAKRTLNVTNSFRRGNLKFAGFILPHQGKQPVIQLAAK